MGGRRLGARPCALPSPTVSVFAINSLDTSRRQGHNRISRRHSLHSAPVNMIPPRPDLSQIDDDIRAYIESLERELERLARPASPQRLTLGGGASAEPPPPAEPPTTINLITISASGVAKRTPRHLYQPQRRGGMGIFDIDLPASDAPAMMAAADASAHLVFITSRARAFRLPVADLPESPVRSKGIALAAKLGLTPEERLTCVLPSDGGPYLVLVTERGHVRRISSHYFAESMRPGSVLFDARDGGGPIAACWTPGDADLLIATHSAAAIRFGERQVPVRGCLGIRLDRDDRIAAVAAVTDDSALFLLGADGKGAIRPMTGFSANKAPGSGGKQIMKADALVAAFPVESDDSIFIISALCKIIRFPAGDVPPKEGVVQGVNCMELRADVSTAAVASR